MWEVIHGDCIEVLKKFPDNSFDSIVTDPPYALSFMGKDWDSFGDGKGFQAWSEEWARECLRVLKPGGCMLAFGGTRTYHREACAVEDAGFEIRDSLHWIYGSGFPKSMNVSVAIDKSLDPKWSHDSPESEAGKQWEGWGTALKPAHEPIILARKPLAEKTVAANVLKYGTGGINIDGCRIGFRNETDKSIVQNATWYASQNETFGKFHDNGEVLSGKDSTPDSGRWPPNVILTHSPDCKPTGTKQVKNKSGSVSKDVPSDPTSDVYASRLRVEWKAHGDADGIETVESWDCSPDCPIAEMDRQSGTLHSGGFNDVTQKARGNTSKGTEKERVREDRAPDSGGASRFFPAFHWDNESDKRRLDPESGACFKYQAKAPKKERPVVEGVAAHPTVKPVALMQWLIRLVTPPGGKVLDPFGGTGTTAQAAELEGFDCTLIERDSDYIELAAERMKDYQGEITEFEGMPTLDDLDAEWAEFMETSE